MYKLYNKATRIYKKIFRLKTASATDKAKYYLANGRVPWSEGYFEYKWQQISNVINNETTINNYIMGDLGAGYGIGLDERIVEYPWIISRLSDEVCNILDAGSTFNFSTIFNQKKIAGKTLTIITYFPEEKNFNDKRISYVYCDLRNIPLRDEWFEEIVCQSTLEHIGMNNEIYGYSLIEDKYYEKSFEFLKVVNELIRVLKGRGSLYITFPFGKFENHGFFQQFDSEMLSRLENILEARGTYEKTFFKYYKTGWRLVSQNEASDSLSYNPHSGAGKLDDGAAHCRGVCCIEFHKK